MINPILIQCYIACLIGNIVHLAIAYLNRSKEFKSVNDKIGLFQFVSEEKAAIIADLCASMALVYAADEWMNSDFVMGKIKTLFIVIGFTGSYAILLLVGTTKKRFQNIADKKSNLSDFGTEEKPELPK